MVVFEWLIVQCSEIRHASCILMKILKKLLSKLSCKWLLSWQRKHSGKVWNLFKVNKKKHLRDVIDVVLLSMLLTMKRFHILFWCFRYWLWTSKYRWGDNLIMGHSPSLFKLFRWYIQNIEKFDSLQNWFCKENQWTVLDTLLLKIPKSFKIK